MDAISRTSNMQLSSFAVYLCGMLAFAAAVPVRPPLTFRSARARSQLISNYDIVHPMVHTTEDSDSGGSGSYPRQMTILLTTGSSTFTLHLELSSDLMSSDFQSIYFDEEGRKVVTKGHANCFYKGSVEEHPSWIVTLSTCRGLRGSFGDIHNTNTQYEVEPYDHSTESLEQPHVLYLASEIEESVDDGDVELAMRLPDEELHSDFNQEALKQRVRRDDDVTYIELLIINDFAMYQQEGQNLRALEEKAMEVVNRMNVLYRPLNIQAVLVGVVTWNDGDKFTVSENGIQGFYSLSDYLTDAQPYNQRHYDSVLLFTGLNIFVETPARRGLLGLAFLGSMCIQKPSGALVEGFHMPEKIATVAAHEIGHQLNITHDEDKPECTCQDQSVGYCIMAGYLRERFPSQWSNCSKKALRKFLNHQRSSCLDNTPEPPPSNLQCRSGFTISHVHGESCNDINECTANNGGCEHTCINTEGSFQCGCREGYHLGEDRKSCEDVNECGVNNGGCGRNMDCVNTQGSHECRCKAGYHLAINGTSCTNHCSQLFTTDTGSIHSPGWPEFYPNNTECEWRVRLSDPNKAIFFSFVPEFGLRGRYPSCTRDWVEIWDVHDERSLGKFCQRTHPANVTTSANEVKIVFHASRKHHPKFKGFSITYQAVELSS